MKTYIELYKESELIKSNCHKTIKDLIAANGNDRFDFTENCIFDSNDNELISISNELVYYGDICEDSCYDITDLNITDALQVILVLQESLMIKVMQN